MEWLKQLGLKLKFRGATAAVAIWIIAMAGLGILGEGPTSDRAMTFLGAGGIVMIGWLIGRTSRQSAARDNPPKD